MIGLPSSGFCLTVIWVPTPSCIKKNQSINLVISSRSMPTKIEATKRSCECYDMHKELVPYAQAWDLQKSIVTERKALVQRNEDSADNLIVLQHHPVYTLGTGGSEDYLHFDTKNAPFNVYRTERGGEVTYHGPGQIVMYPIMNLRYQKMDLHWYLRTLEEVIIRALSSSFSIKASRIDGLTGVWIGDEKLAAIGVKVSQWITSHGLALNVTTDLAAFQHIVPCGIKGRRVGSIKEILLRESSSSSYSSCNKTDDDLQLIELAHKSLAQEFCELFQVDIFINNDNYNTHNSFWEG
ncbi:hypothetical protein DM860_013278 [Cuscuta australis]|uniref:lipoyl(octanoyl) transferase n=1 Tax=Cuscuta australis TaxID=267555 RepID=A0A328DTE2_9ASTE|nr:hypothetical protein DM860_013278 [Cuscuta australis]